MSFPATPTSSPRDHFAHPSFDSEWWYYTGNLFTAGGRHFGFELTFFRRAREIEVAEPSAWDLDQVWLAHFTITDTREERFVVDERINRSGPGVAGADASKRRIWNGNWSIGWRPGDENRPTQVLTAMTRDASLRLTLTPRQAGRRPRPGRGEPQDRRRPAGRLPLPLVHPPRGRRDRLHRGDELAVTGLAWMDHEFFSDYPLEDKVGWDWMSIQLEDGVDLMLFGLRDASGGHGPDTTGTLVEAHGEARRIEWGGVRLRARRRWRSEATGAEYPVEWEVAMPGLALRLDVRPRIDGQEVHTEGGLLPAYWEGAVVVSGEREGRPVSGVGYLEMTGYAERFALGDDGAGGEATR